MALWKRGEWYWADFTVNGTRYRVPLHTKDQREAKRLEKDWRGPRRKARGLPFGVFGSTEF